MGFLCLKFDFDITEMLNCTVRKMPTKQKIYGRWEYPLGETTTNKLFEFYHTNIVFDKTGVQVGGISAARNVKYNTAILMTYDKESELMLTLKFACVKNVIHVSYIPIL